MVDGDSSGGAGTGLELLAVVSGGKVAPTYQRLRSALHEEVEGGLLTENTVHVGRLRIRSDDGIELFYGEGVEIVLSISTRSAQG